MTVEAAHGDKPAFLSHHLVNLAVGAVFCWFVWRSLQSWLVSGSAVDLILRFRNGSLTILFLCRRRANLTSRSAKEWAIAILGTFMGYFYRPEGEPFQPALLPAAYSLMLIAGAMSLLAVLSLGRSFGIVPAHRGLKTTGLYRFVRHPIYLFYLLFDLGFLLRVTTWINGAIYAGFILSLWLRATYEERILRQDPDYVAYATRTRYMFLPGLV